MSTITQQAFMQEALRQMLGNDAARLKATLDEMLAQQQAAYQQAYAAQQRAYAYQQYGFASPPVVPASDPYSVLGLPRSATRQEVNRRHRQLAREYRDDADKLKALNNAYNAIKGAQS